MADLEVLKKGSGYRLDHADFGEVCKTTFAKGVITDIKKVEDDPIAVESLVKVEVEGQGESEFIPLFHQPRKGYWDTEDHQAQEFNQENKCFENAWMSFRGGDKVKVMLREDKPAAVVGHLDGIPRIGEDIFKLFFNSIGGGEHQSHIQCSKRELYGVSDEEAEGPDGTPLGLTKEAVKSCDTGEVLEVEEVLYGFSGRVTDPAAAYYKTTYYHYRTYCEFLIPIGAILYLLQAFQQRTESYIEPLVPLVFGEPIEEPGWGNPLSNTGFWVLAVPYDKEIEDELIKQGKANSGINPKDIELDHFTAEGDWGYYFDYPDMIYQDEFTDYIMTNEDFGQRAQLAYEDKMDLSTLQIFCRPHTEEDGLS